MRGDHPVRDAAWPIVSDSISQNLNRTMSGFGRPFAPIGVFEPDDVVQLRRRDLEDRRVLDCRDAVDRPGREAKRASRADDLRLEHRLPGFPELELGLALEDVPAFVFLAMELEAQRLARANAEELPGVFVRLRPDQLVAPWLFHLVRLKGEAIQALEVRGGQRPLHGWAILRLKPLRVLGEVLLGAPQVLRRVDGQPQPLVTESGQAALGGELWEGRRLVVAALGEARERLVSERIDAAADPALDRPAFREAGDALLLELDHAERRLRLRDRDRRRCPVGAMLLEQRGEIDVEQLVSVQPENVAVLPALLRGETDATSPTEPFRLLGDLDLWTEACERFGELVAGAKAAADDHPRHAGPGQKPDLPRCQWTARDRDERLRNPAGGVAEALGLAARQNDRFHYSVGAMSRSSVSGKAESGEEARPIPS